MKKLTYIFLIVCVLISASLHAKENINVVEIKVSLGGKKVESMKLELYPDRTPKTVANFLSYTKDKFYDGTIFHRVINNFMIQGGGFNPGLVKKDTKAKIVNEAKKGIKNKRGTIAMARTQDPHSATAQFFINDKDNPSLNYFSDDDDKMGYVVFGKLISGTDVLDKISAVKTGFKNGFSDVPKKDVKIISVRLIK